MDVEELVSTFSVESVKLLMVSGTSLNIYQRMGLY